MTIGTLEEKVVEIERELCDIKKGVVYRIIIDMVEKPLIEYALARTDGNQLKAARILGINRNTIRSKMRRFGIDINRLKTL